MGFILMSSFIDIPRISFRGLQNSARVLQNLRKYYFPLYDLGWNDFFTCYPVLAYFAALVYQADHEVEVIQRRGATASDLDSCAHIATAIEELFRDREILTPSIEREVQHGAAYGLLESRIMGGGAISHADLKRAMELRTFDLRILHRVVLAILNRPVEEPIFELLFPLEVLMEIQDDLTQYHDDVVKGSFNTYRILVRLFGTEAPSRLRVEIQHYQAMFERRLAAMPAAFRNKFIPAYQDLCNEFPMPPIPEPLPE